MRIIIIAFALPFLFFVACEKPAGEGGTSSITGKVFMTEYNVNGIIIAQYYAAREDVFIVYGDNLIYDDRMETHHDGSYEFKYLRKGTYQIFAYSDCDTCAAPTQAILKQVETTENNQQVVVDDLAIDKR